MRVDDRAVFTAELEGLRRLARLPRPKVPIRAEEVPGALCLWGSAESEGSHRYDVRLVPGSGVPLADVLRAVRASGLRPAGGYLYVRGVAASFDPETVALLGGLGASRDTGRTR